MKNKNFLLVLENHVDKIALAIVCLISLFLLGRYVVFNPYSVKVDGRKLKPSTIDNYVKNKADRLNEQLAQSSKAMSYNPHLPKYKKLQQCSVSAVESTMVLMQNPGVGIRIEEEREYSLPMIPGLSEIQIAHLRGAAQIPVEQSDSEITYPGGGGLDDVDLITVSSRFDVQMLYDNFQKSFDGPRLKTSWKSPHLAKPVFAKMELQRRTHQEDGTWGDWQIVPSARIDVNRELFEELPLTLNNSPFGVEDYWMPQFDQQDVQLGILQPHSYEFMISLLEWMPPEFLEESRQIAARQKQKAKREALEERRSEETEKRRTEGRRADRPAARRPARAEAGRDRGAINDPFARGGMDETGIRGRRAPKERTIEDVKKDVNKALLTEIANVSRLREPLLVWAHDDTVTPGGTYQYRLRLGLFNPIAGKDWFTDEQSAYKNQTVLWSPYSEVTEAISIPRRVYVFPKDVVTQKDQTKKAQAVEVEVMKYQMGQWHDHEFEVVPGQAIGYKVQESDEQSNRAMEGVFAGTAQTSSSVDFSTDWTLVDINQQNVWGSRLRPKSLDQMLYCDEDMTIGKMVIGEKDWDSQTREIYDEIQEKMEQSVEQRDFGGEMRMPERGPIIPGRTPVIPGRTPVIPGR